MEPKKHHSFRAFACFILSLIILVLVICNVILSDLRYSVLKGKNIDVILSHTKTYSTVEEVLIETITEASKDYNISREAIEEIITDGVIETTSHNVFTAIMSGEKMDFTYLDESVEKSVILITDTGVKKILKDIEEQATSVTVSEIAESSAIRNLEKEYNVSISTELTAALSPYTVDDKLVISAQKKDAIEKEIYQVLYRYIYPAITKIINEYKDECNDIVNDAIKDAEDENSFSSTLRKVDDALQLADYAIIGIWILCLLLFGLQMLIYKKENHRAFRNLAIVTIITTLFKFACIGGLLFARTQLISSIKKEDDPFTDHFIAYITYNMDLIKKCVIISSVIFAALSVGLIIASVKLKQRRLMDNTPAV